MRLLIPLIFALSACSPVFKLGTSQGNLIDDKKLAQVETGMTQEQVRYLLGTPLLTDEFQPERWDYTAYYRSGAGKEQHRTVSLFFNNGELQRIEDSNPPKKAVEQDSDEPAAQPAQ